MAKFSHVQFPNGEIHDVVGTDVVDQQSIKSGSLVNFSTNVALPLTALTSTIVAQQAGTGTPSPSNPRSISGVSSVKFVQTGKNLFDKNNLIDGKAISSDGSIIDGNYAKLTDYIPINGQCTFSAVHIGGTAALRLGLYDENKNFISRAVSTVGAVGSLTTLTINNSNVKFVRANLFTTGENVNTAQVEQGLTATTYEAYTGNTFTVALGDTYYGGILDAKNGKATITHGMSILDGSDENWSLASDGTTNRRFVLYGLPAFKNGSTSIANYLVYATGTSHDFGTYGIGKSEQYGYYIVLHDKSSDFASKDALKSYLAEHNLEVVYELETPVEITGLTPANFTTFIGTNIIFSDSGDVTVKYFAGTNVNKAIDDISELKINAHHDAFGALTDTNISSPSNGQIVKYNGTKWVNADNSANGVAVDCTTMQIQNTTVQKFLDVLYDALKDTTVELTASGSIANFTTSLVKPLTALTSTIVAQQAGGTPTPSSPLPISGFSSVSFTQQDNESTTVDSFTIQLGQTVYGGTIDAISGKATITHQIVDLGDKTWTYNETRHYFTASVSGIKRPATTLITTGGISSVFVPASSYKVVSEIDDDEFAVSSSSDTLMIRCTTYTDKDTFKTAMQTANAQLVYELATPVEIDITANNFTTISGEQNIFSDCGEVSVGFKQGIQEYIDAKIAETQA